METAGLSLEGMYLIACTVCMEIEGLSSEGIYLIAYTV